MKVWVLEKNNTDNYTFSCDTLISLHLTEDSAIAAYLKLLGDGERDSMNIRCMEVLP